MIVVIGQSGQLAQELEHNRLGIPVVCLGRNSINLHDEDSIATTLSSYNPVSIINASAYTAVDKAENEVDAAFALNSLAVKNLGNYCSNNNIHLVHVSTDYVFDGNYSSPIMVSEEKRPLGIYGASKAEGENQLAAISGLSYCIVRTAWVYSRYENNFVKTMLRLMREKSELAVVCDQIGSPTWASGLAEACLNATSKKITGIHHWTDNGVASWYDFAVAIQQTGMKLGLLEKLIPIKPVTSAEFPTPAKRPSYSVLDKSSLPAYFSDVPQKHWQEQLESMMKLLVNK